MAHILSVLLALAPAQAQIREHLKHVKEGQEYLPSQQSDQVVRNPSLLELSTTIAEDKFSTCTAPCGDDRSLYDYSSEDIEKLRNVSFSHENYTGQVMLVVNLASFWGYTPQYYSLNALTEKYADQPFKILGFPCNQFLRQEPGANASEIFAVLKHVRPGDDFVPNFEMFAKSDVNGKNENPIYTFLKSRCPSVRKEFQAPYKLYYDPYHQDDIRWNFEKFLINKSGHPVRRYDESLDPMEIVPDIDALLHDVDEEEKKNWENEACKMYKCTLIFGILVFVKTI